VILAPIKTNQRGDMENNDINTLELQKTSLFRNLSLSNLIYLRFVIDGRVTLTDAGHPTTEVGNLPPCLFAGFIVNIDPISKNI
jgi:hypothetical protein